MLYDGTRRDNGDSERDPNTTGDDGGTAGTTSGGEDTERTDEM